MAGQSFGVPPAALLLLLQELRGRRGEEGHVVHRGHGLHLGRGDEVRGGERAVADDRLPLQRAVQVLQEVRLKREGAGCHRFGRGGRHGGGGG